MDSSELYGRSSRKELQGPRPTPLKIHKDSHKIRKPPAAPPAASRPHHHHHLPPPPPPRQPVIIYTVSPKIIHTNPSDFMNLVQRLTGHSSTTTSTSATTITKTTSNNNDNFIINNNNNNNIIVTNPSFYDGQFGGGAISPAARYATIEKANNNNNNNNNINIIDQHSILLSNNNNHNVLELGLDQNSSTEIVNYSHINNYIMNNNKGFFSGILSPGPGSLPPITPNFFSPPSDAFFQDLISPAIHGGIININNNNNNINIHRNFIDQASSFFVSPRTLMASPTTPSLDHLLFTNIFSDNNNL